MAKGGLLTLARVEELKPEPLWPRTSTPQDRAAFLQRLGGGCVSSPLVLGLSAGLRTRDGRSAAGDTSPQPASAGIAVRTLGVTRTMQSPALPRDHTHSGSALASRGLFLPHTPRAASVPRYPWRWEDVFPPRPSSPSSSPLQPPSSRNQRGSTATAAPGLSPVLGGTGGGSGTNSPRTPPPLMPAMQSPEPARASGGEYQDLIYFISPPNKGVQLFPPRTPIPPAQPLPEVASRSQARWTPISLSSSSGPPLSTRHRS